MRSAFREIQALFSRPWSHNMVFTLRPSAHLPCLATRAGIGTISPNSGVARFVQGGVAKPHTLGDSINRGGSVALIFRGKTQCSICGEILAEGDDIVATSHFIADSDDPLWRFSDSGMHRSCFVGWPLRDTFIARYNDAVGRHQRMADDGSIVDA